jgi:hypothetical protein
MSSITAGAILSSRFRALRHRNFRLFWIGQPVSPSDADAKVA